MDVAAKRQSLGRKFLPVDVDTNMAFGVKAALQAYSGSNAFLASVRWQMASKGLTAAQIAAAANWLFPVTAAPTAKTPVATAKPDGFYTIVLGEDQIYATLRLSTWKGAQTVAYLSGANNETNYTRFARLYPNNKRWYAPGCARQVQALQILLAATVEATTGLAKGYALQSGNCYRCGRLLTTPESITLGIGPICRAKEAV